MSNGTIKIKIQETSQFLSIMRTSDLEKLFPDVDLSPAVWWLALFCIAITRGGCRVSVASEMDFFMTTFISRQQLDIVTGSSVLGVAGVLFLPLAIMHKTCVVLQFFTSSFCLLLPTSHLFWVSKASVL